ncbi:MAG: hypothetical protein ACYC8V_05910, partial [Caulobacteraceae bacterium]
MTRRLCTAWLGAAVVLLAIAAPTIFADPERVLTDLFLITQDLPVLAAVSLPAAALLVLPGLRGRVGGTLAGWAERAQSRISTASGPGPRRGPGEEAVGVVLLALASFAIAWAGGRFTLLGYPLSMDEFMARFDAAIFRHGRLMAAVPPFWRPLVTALQPMFLLRTPGDAFWTSAYLPMNAAFRALAGPAESLVNPAWAAISVVAVFGVARRLWPQRPTVGLVAAALLASSSQFLANAMTSYAMPSHLALNLVWLCLFLRGGRLGHIGAAAVGFVACGLHQLVFHPLFAAPFILQLWLERRWRPAAFYTLAYAAICLFWIFYWTLALRTVGLAPPSSAHASAGGFVAEVVGLVAAFNPADFGLMAKNLIRLMTWQNPLAVALALAGAAAAVRAKGMVRAMALGVALMAAAVFVLLAYQGYGWGYRYLHGALGSLCLLAAFEWDRLTESLSKRRKAAAGAVFLAVALASIAILLPW